MHPSAGGSIGERLDRRDKIGEHWSSRGGGSLLIYEVPGRQLALSPLRLMFRRLQCLSVLDTKKIHHHLYETLSTSSQASGRNRSRDSNTASLGPPSSGESTVQPSVRVAITKRARDWTRGRTFTFHIDAIGLHHHRHHHGRPLQQASRPPILPCPPHASANAAYQITIVLLSSDTPIDQSLAESSNHRQSQMGQRATDHAGVPRQGSNRGAKLHGASCARPRYKGSD